MLVGGLLLLREVDRVSVLSGLGDLVFFGRQLRAVRGGSVA